MLDWTLLRLAVLFAALMAVDLACQIGPSLLHLPLLPKGGVFAFTQPLGTALAMFIAYRVLIRWTEHRPATELALPDAPANFALGAGLGFALFASVFVILAILGTAQIAGYAGLTYVAPEAAAALAAAIGEEVILRGTVFRLLEESFGTLVALCASALIFGLLHVANPGASLASTAAIALEAGVLLAAAYAASRTLWLPIGLHFGWNFTEGGIFGGAVSGGAGHGAIVSRFTGDPLLSGGVFGPEASVVAVGAALAVALVFVGIAIARGRWEPVRVVMRGGRKPKAVVPTAFRSRIVK
jgi:membrane protease YdiL (CAAX protease family)